MISFYAFSLYFFLIAILLFIKSLKVFMLRRRILKECELEKEFRVQRMWIDTNDR